MSISDDLDAASRAKLAGVRLLSLDVDGVQTDGGVYYDEDGRVSRKFNVKDGVGVERVRAAGIAVTIISAGSTGAIEHRGRRLGIEHIHTGVSDKLATLVALAEALGIDMEHVAHMGDDINDVPLMQSVGCPLSVADGIDEARDAAIYVTQRKGGDAAVREVCDLLLALRDGNGL